MKYINLSQGKKAIVDDDDYEKLLRKKWFFHQGYAIANTHNHKSISMHRFIIKPGPGFEVDHINRNRLDNRKINLRLCTRSQNMANIPFRSNNTSGYKGVTYQPHRKRYLVRTKCNGRFYYLGRFTNIEEAAIAYDCAAIQLFGDFAMTNIL